MALKTVTASLLAGGIALGAIVSWNGGEIIDRAQEMIQEQAADLNLFGQQQKALVDKIVTMKAELKELLDNGRPEDQARIAELTALIAEAEANVTSDTQAVSDHIEAQEAEMNKANADAAELETTMNETEATPEPAPLSARELAEITDTIPAGYTILGMISDTPQLVPNTSLTIDKTTDANAELFIANTGSVVYYLTIDGQKITITQGSSVSLGLVKDLDGSSVEITDSYGADKGKYYLSAE